MRKKTVNKKIIISFLLALLVLVSRYSINLVDNGTIDGREKVLVTRVVDGDTIVIDSGEKVRLILVNTPESVHSDESRNTEFGIIASKYTTKMLLNKTVYLETDVSDKDQYGRLLRYVYLEDGTFFNELLVREGYAQMVTFPPDVKYKDIIYAAETYARENNKGLWGYDD